MRETNALLIGCGAMGLRHAQALNSLGIPIVGALDPSTDALESGVQQGLFAADVAYSYADLMFGAVRAELAVIATTAPFHADYVQRAAAAGVTHILCEKPLAPSLAECQAILAACEKHGIACAVNHQRRYMEQYRRAGLLAAEQILGPLDSFQVTAGNFGIAMNGSHYIEIASHLFAERFTHVSGWLNEESLPNPRGPEYQDFSGCIRAITATGRRFYLDASGSQGHGLMVTIAGRDGQIQIDDLQGRMHINHRQPEHTGAATTRYALPYTTDDIEFRGDIITITAQVVRALLEGEDYPDLQDGMHTIEVLIAAHLSNELGGSAVALNELQGIADRRFPWA